MRACRFIPLVLAGALAACDGHAPPTPASDVEYRPELSGTVDHALCLLGFSAVPLERLATGHNIVEGRVNGKPARFVLDTGANISLVHMPYAEAFGLTAQPGVAGMAIGLGGGQRAARARVEELRIGYVASSQRHVMLADLSQLESLLGRLSRQPIHGIIGQDVMRDQRMVIDVARPMLYLRADASAPAPVLAERCEASEGGAASSG